jgi:hypothetical protein
MKVLLRNHGATLSGVKADLYTMIGVLYLLDFSDRSTPSLLGIDSKHSSGIPSTVSRLICHISSSSWTV